MAPPKNQSKDKDKKASKKEKVDKVKENLKKAQDKKEFERRWKNDLRGLLEDEANFEEERESHFRESSCADDNIVWEDPFYQNYDKVEQQKFSNQDEKEAERCWMILTDTVINSYNNLCQRPNYKENDEIIMTPAELLKEMKFNKPGVMRQVEK